MNDRPDRPEFATAMRGYDRTDVVEDGACYCSRALRGEQFDKDLLTPVSWHLFGGAYNGTFLPVGGNYRYRTYETVIPIRNELWNSL